MGIGRKVFIPILSAFALVACSRPATADFITLKNGHFEDCGRRFFPLAVNYILHLQFEDSTCWAAPFRNYERNDVFRFNHRDSSLMLVKAEFELIKQMGFNTVRLVGITSDLIMTEGDSALSLRAQYGFGTDSLYRLSGDQSRRYFNALNDVVQLAEETGLRLILLVKLVPGQPEYEAQWLKMADRFRDDPAVMAYDFFNEPLYFDIHDRPKREVHELVKGWQEKMRTHAPHQLSTIGLVGVPEVFAWDPNVLAVDFISFHPYEYEPEQVRNELYWYGEQVDKPWIIGETSLPADNDSVPYADQLAFARNTLAQTVACGGVGYSWWQFKDVKWGKFHADYMGVMNQQGWTEAGPGLPRVEGTIKPVVKAFQEFDPKAKPGKCVMLPNYYNYSSLHGAKLTGRLVNSDRRPVEGGVILGWNEGWTRSYYTTSKADGSFELYGDFRFHHWMVSATRYSMVRGDCFPNEFLTGKDSIPSYYLGDLVLEKVGYANKPGK